MMDLVAKEILVHRFPESGVHREITRLTDGLLAVPADGAPLDVGALLAAAGSGPLAR